MATRSVQYFQRGDHVLEVRTISSTERYTRRLPAAVMIGEQPAALPSTKPRGPGIARKAANAARSTAKHVSKGSPKATDAQVAERFAICSSNACGLYDAKGDGRGTCLHATCGCNLRSVGDEDLLPNKLRWADQECPVAMWPAITPDGAASA